jgi:hypothetical protein
MYPIGLFLAKNPEKESHFDLADGLLKKCQDRSCCVIFFVSGDFAFLLLVSDHESNI